MKFRFIKQKKKLSTLDTNYLIHNIPHSHSVTTNIVWSLDSDMKINRPSNLSLIKKYQPSQQIKGYGKAPRI